MKKVTMTVTEFLQFRQIAEQRRIKFTSGCVRNGLVDVRASKEDLEQIGY